MELREESRAVISGAASATQNSSILRQQRVGGPSYPDLPPYAVTNPHQQCTTCRSKKLFKGLQFGIGDIKNDPVIAVRISPMAQVVTLTRDGLLRRASARRYWPYMNRYS